jgi:3-phenylpropionate/trans-cinnamate dioxygenase ferredoxin subunit
MRRESALTPHVVASADEIPVGGRKIVRLEGRSIRVFNVNGTYYALAIGI